MTRYQAPRRILRGTSACRRANRIAITAPGTGDENGRGDNIVVSASATTSGVVPTDVEIAVALGTPHAGGALLEAGALAAVGTDPVARAPRERQPRRARRPRHHGPARGPRRENLE